jgi:hypothetical protein
MDQVNGILYEVAWIENREQAAVLVGSGQLAVGNREPSTPNSEPGTD